MSVMPPEDRPVQSGGNYSYPTQVTAKNPAVATLLSILWPGLGHVYVGRTAAGIVQMLLLTPLIWVLNVTVIGLFLGIPLWVMSAVYAHYVAKDFNHRNGVLVR